MNIVDRRPKTTFGHARDEPLDGVALTTRRARDLGMSRLEVEGLEGPARRPARTRSSALQPLQERPLVDRLDPQLKCPVGTIKGRLSRARQTLRDRLSRRGLDSYPEPLGATWGG